MSDIGESSGIAVGGLTTGAVDGRQPGASVDKSERFDRGHFAEGACLNCGTELVGSHCHACGQEAHLHRTLGAFMHDLLHGALHFEGKTWKTLPKLVLKPGELTRRYIDGERARFVSPMALFLFSIFLMFAAFQIVGITMPIEFDGSSWNEGSTQTSEDIARLEARISELDRQIVSAEGREQESLRQKRDELAFELSALRTAENFIDRTGGDETPIASPEDTVTEEGSPNDLNQKGTGLGWIDKGLKKWSEQPALMLYKLQANFYKFSWLLIPLSVPFVWLLFAWKRQFKAYDHAIFVTYSLSFMTLFILAITILGVAGLHASIITLAATFIPPIHIYKQLRGTYGIGRLGALWRLVVLVIFILVILALFLQALLLLGLF